MTVQSVEANNENNAGLPLVTLRVRCGCNTMLPIGQLSKCLDCCEYMCHQHVCGCPIPGIEELDAA